jgi:asparagine synthase (glutamine-hydrolysing)
MDQRKKRVQNMCGIAGYISDHPVDPDPSLLVRMCDRIQHRGPDAYGYYQKGPVALGHRRLSIIDVSGGNQPLGNEDGSIQIIFNGEIYNYLELRADLVKRQHQFVTQSDTEVLAHLYEEVGERLPDYLNGMFAFAIWDASRQELFLARDPFGKKPLYYSTSTPGYRLCFASELKALTAIPRFDYAVNSRSIADFLTFGYIPDPETAFRNVQKLEPGSSLLVSRSDERRRKYWTPRFEADEGADFNRSIGALAELAADSVERRMISDVPLGGFLSGGVDSSAVVAFMAQRAGGRVKSFSIGFTDENFNELEYARMVARRYQTEHYEEVVTPSVYDTLRTLVDHYDEPFADASAIPTLYLCRMTRQHVTVALSGDGADELFGGYRRYRFAVAEEQIRKRVPRWLRRSVIRKAGEIYPQLDTWPRVFRGKATLCELSYSFPESYASAMSAFRYGALNEVLSAELKRELDGYSPIVNYMDRFKKYAHLPALKQLQAVDLETYLPGDILVKVDRASMAYSLEARCPWLDYRMGNLAGSLPADFLLKNGRGKHIFKEMVGPHIPEAIINRPKMGFGGPLHTWMRTSLKPVFEALVLRPEFGRYVELGAVKRIWDRHQSGQRDFSRDLWHLLMLACWHDRHASSQRTELLAEVAASCSN